MKISLPPREKSFSSRHISLERKDFDEMLSAIGVESIEQLIDQTIPKSIKMSKNLGIGKAKGELEFLSEFEEIMDQNEFFKNYIGMGYYNTIVPPVLQRNILENPGWYTAYTPYQAEISQGRLEALINFQTLIVELTGLDIANASLLDEGTAAAEAMTMFFNKRSKRRKQAHKFFVDKNVFPQTLEIFKTRSTPIGIELIVDSLEKLDFSDEEIFGIFVQYPNNDGSIVDIRPLMTKASSEEVLVCVGADLLSLCILTPPGEMGADAVIGTTQRFGVPLGYGGPHAAYFATKEKFKRQIPGRIIGASVDKFGNEAFRMALQTREQHIRREKATSNICTAQVLLAVMAGMYAVYHGPKGLKRIAQRIIGLTTLLNNYLTKLGYEQCNTYFFDTLKLKVQDVDRLRMIAESKRINLRYFKDNAHVGISIDETTTEEDIEDLIRVFAIHDGSGVIDLGALTQDSIDIDIQLPEELIRTSDFLQYPVFQQYHSEHEMLRYLKRLENKDLSLTHSMISLGSCTMKLNATAEMIPLTWNSISQMHPFAPKEQALGYHTMIAQLSRWLCDITGFQAMSLQPNSGAQGEYAGLLVIRDYHLSRGEGHRNISLIPSSAHGTNPASAVMAGMKVVIVNCDENGNIDLSDLRTKAEAHKDNLAALMVTYPSTHGVLKKK